MKPRLGSLFSGYGGLDLAVEEVFDAETVWVSDIDPGPSKILAHRFPDAPNLGDITTVDWTQVPPVDIIAGGSPCQDISSAGRMAGMREGTRSNLWVQMRQAIATLRPRYVIWENVGAARSTAATSAMESDPRLLGDHPAGQPVLRALGRVLGDLASLGYDAQWHSLRAADVGAPHGRLRYFVLAADADRAGRLEHGRPVAVPPQQSAAERGGRDAGLADRDANDIQGDRPTVGEHLLQSCREGVMEVGGDVVGDGGRNGDGSHTSDRNDLAKPVNLLPTPRATDGTKGGPNQRGSSGDLMLPSAVMQLLPSPVAQPSGNSPEDHLRKKPGRKQVTDLAIIVENGLLETGGQLLPTPSVADTQGGRKSRSGARNGELLLNGIADQQAWGPYTAAIARWEAIVGPAPSPTKPGRNGRPKLNPEFAAWMMGAAPGWITDVPGVTDNEALRMAGNGVVQQQAEAALRLMLQRMERNRRMTIHCLAPAEACGAGADGHHCTLPPDRHDDLHRCPCGEAWERDDEFELACKLYREHYTVRYLDAPEFPPAAVVEAACRPTDSPWRRLVRIAARHWAVAR